MDAVDIAIIGAGLAGLTAANRAAQLGLRPVVLEKGNAQDYMCNTRLTGGALHVAYREPRAQRSDIEAAIRAATSNTASEALVAAVAEGAPRLVDWLQQEGVRFIRGGVEEYKRWLLAPPRPQRPGLHWKGLGGDLLLRTLEANLGKRGVTLRRGSRVTGLERRGDLFVVSIERGEAVDTLLARAVVIADGGFQANPDLLRQHISPRPEAVFTRNAGTGAGDGLQFAVALGAATLGLERFYGHVLSSEVFTNDRLSPFPWADPLAVHGIVVNRQGMRFVNESLGGVLVSNAIAALEDPLSAIAIFDEKVWYGPAREGAIPPNPNLEIAGASIHTARSLSELAAQLDVPPGALEDTVVAVNAAIAAGTPGQLTPPRGASAVALDRPPYRALRLAAGITYTMGGIAIDGNARVLDAAGNSIPGLYAAGSATGGLEGGPGTGYVGGLVKAGVTGLNAAEHIASAH